MKKILSIVLLIFALGVMVGCQNETQLTNQSELTSEKNDVNIASEENGEDTSEVENEMEVDIQSTQYEFEADLTHDGVKEKVCVMVDASDEEMPPLVMITVIQAEEKLYEQELICNMALGSACYLVQVDGKDYLMNYNPLVDHDMATCEYSVFSISESGETVVLDEQSIELSLFEVETMNKEEWIAFAEKENTYFENAYLVASTIDGDLINGTTEPVTTYKEVFAWMVFSEGNVDSVEEALELFVKENMEVYGE